MGIFGKKEKMIKCPKCNVDLKDGSKFCGFCGTKFDVPDKKTDGAGPSKIDKISSSDDIKTVKLIKTALIYENGKKTYEMMKNSITIGRGKDCELQIDKEFISRKHCSISKYGGKFFLKDLGSTNGTLLNDKKVEETGVELDNDDKIKIGEYVIVFKKG